MSWVCPDCGRSFGRARQWHSCRASAPLDEWLAARAPAVHDVLDAVTGALAGVGPVVVETTRSAVMIKRSRTFAEVKPRRGHVDVAFILPRLVRDPRVQRTLDLSPSRVAHVIAVSGAEDVDADVRAWLVEAYEQSPV